MRRLWFVPLLLWCSGCALFQADHFGAYPVSYSDLSGWTADDHAQALTTFTATCPFLTVKAREKSSGSGLRVSRDVWRSLCNDALAIPVGNSEQARLFFETRFIPFRVTNNGKDRGLFTGYYEPVLFGSRQKKGKFIYPLYMAPADLAHRTPYYTHAEIDHGVLRHRGLELVWVDDAVMLFFLQIQGSGRVRLVEGGEMPVGYAGQNGRPYVSLGKYMGDAGLLPKDDINFFTIRQYLYDHPGQAFDIMEHNPSYVFFKRLDQAGAIGAAGAVLTPQRSLAVDNKYIPYGLPLFMETDLPALPGGSPTWFHRTLIAQDTGGAIRGPVRADVFFGNGNEAEYLAGYMKGHGVYSLLVPKEIAGQLQ